jgi:hypothetical protein
MTGSRHYEIFLPLRYNDGTNIPEALLSETLWDLRKQFGAVTWETQIIRGEWEHEGKVFADDLMRVMIDVPDTAPNRDFFRNFKGVLKVRFQQIDIWMTTHTIDIV